MEADRYFIRQNNELVAAVFRILFLTAVFGAVFILGAVLGIILAIVLGIVFGIILGIFTHGFSPPLRGYYVPAGAILYQRKAKRKIQNIF